MDQRLPDGVGAISRKKLNERLMAVLGQRTADLDDEEITAITEFCHKSVRRRTCHNLVQAGVEEIADSVQVIHPFATHTISTLTASASS